MPASAEARGRVSIVDVARVAQVSKSTVSLVITGRGAVKPETRDRIRGAMDALGYVYNRGAGNLRNPRADVVGMVINDLANPFFAELAIGIERVLQVSGAVPFMAHTAENPVRQAQVMRSMREHGASGLILCPTRDTTAGDLDEFSGAGLPLVLAMRRVAGAQASVAAPDNRTGSTRAARHLIGLGHRRIAYLGGYRGTVVREDRFAGFTAAMAEAGLAIEEADDIESPPTKDGGFQAVGPLLRTADGPTALLCYNDAVAIGAMLAAARAGRRVGADLSVIGFDDIAEARYTSPALTTVSVDAVGLGEQAAGLLLRQIARREAGQRLSGPDIFVGEARLVIRESCGPAPLFDRTSP